MLFELNGCPTGGLKCVFCYLEKSCFSKSTFFEIVKISFVFIAFSPHGFTKIVFMFGRKTVEIRRPSSSSRKRPKVENVVILLYREHFGPPITGKREGPQETLRGTLWRQNGVRKGTPCFGSPSGPSRTPLGPLLVPFFPLFGVLEM